MEEIANWGRRAIWICAFLLATFFAFLQLREHKYAAAIQNVDPKTLREFTLAIYYAAWVFGTSADLKIQRYVLFIDPKKGEIPKYVIITVVVFILAAIGLIFAREEDKIFAIALLIFLIAETVGWRILVYRFKPVYDESGEYYGKEKDWFSVLELDAVKEYTHGRWNWLRRLSMTLILIIIFILTFFTSIREKVANLLSSHIFDIGEGTIFALFPPVLFGIYVVIAELWQYLMRFRTFIKLSVLKNLRKEYKLSRIQ